MPLVVRARRASGRAAAGLPSGLPVGLPFGYHAWSEGGLLILRRPDGSFVSAFPAAEADPFEVEASVWEDAD